jgi:hypothetical protein
MANGRLGLSGLGALGVLRLVCGVLVVIAVFVPLYFLLRVATTRGTRAAGTDPARDLFLAFWGCTAVFLALAFIGTTLALDANSIRYLPPLFYAVAATVPFLAPRVAWGRVAVCAGVTFVGVVGAVLLHRAALAEDFNVAPQDAQPLIALLEQHGVHRGYAGYWQGNLLTWESAGAVTSRAVQQGNDCKAAQPGWFCPYPIFTLSDWYAPQSGPTFLIRERRGAFVPDPPPTTLVPRETFSYGRFDVYVYGDDLGTDAAAAATGWPG